jgi:hypothetical protein
VTRVRCDTSESIPPVAKYRRRHVDDVSLSLASARVLQRFHAVVVVAERTLTAAELSPCSAESIDAAGARRKWSRPQPSPQLETPALLVRAARPAAETGLFHDGNSRSRLGIFRRKFVEQIRQRWGYFTSTKPLSNDRRTSLDNCTYSTAVRWVAMSMRRTTAARLLFVRWRDCRSPASTRSFLSPHPGSATAQRRPWLLQLPVLFNRCRDVRAKTPGSSCSCCSRRTRSSAAGTRLRRSHVMDDRRASRLLLSLACTMNGTM